MSIRMIIVLKKKTQKIATLVRKKTENSNVGKAMEKLEAACTADSDMNWCRHQRRLRGSEKS